MSIHKVDISAKGTVELYETDGGYAVSRVSLRGHSASNSYPSIHEAKRMYNMLVGVAYV